MDSLLQAGEVARTDPRRRVLIVDDHRFFAACLRTLLDGESDLIVCDILASSAELRERIARLNPDLLVIDLSLGTENGIEVGQRLRSLGIATPILFVSSLNAPTAEQLTVIARSGFIAKSQSPAEFLAALRRILATPLPRADAPVDLGAARPVMQT